MRSILILTAIMAQLFLTNISWADAHEDCKESCETDKEARDIDCPSPYDSSPEAPEGRERDQCMRTSQEAYNRCLINCPAPTPPAPPSSESPAPMGY